MEVNCSSPPFSPLFSFCRTKQDMDGREKKKCADNLVKTCIHVIGHFFSSPLEIFLFSAENREVLRQIVLIASGDSPTTSTNIGLIQPAGTHGPRSPIQITELERNGALLLFLSSLLLFLSAALSNGMAVLCCTVHGVSAWSAVAGVAQAAVYISAGRLCNSTMHGRCLIHNDMACLVPAPILHLNSAGHAES